MTKRIRDQILKVRDDGRTNMLDTNGVMYVANDLLLFDLVVYLDDKENRKEYWNFIMTGEANITDDDGGDPEDEEVDPDDEEDYGSPPTREEQKAMAINYMKAMKLDPAVIREFEENGTVFTCRALDGVPIATDSATMEDIRALEKQYGFLVYLNVQTEMFFGSLRNLFIVSKYKEDWAIEERDIADGYAMCYVINDTAPECSEMGSICFTSNDAGGIYREG